MQRMDLTATQLRAYHRALRRSHTRRIRVAVQTLDGETLASITPRVLDGEIVVDLDAEVTRMLTMSFLDPHHRLNFDAESPGDGALYADRLLRVYYSIRVPELGRRVTAIPFTGPIVKLERAGDVVTVTAHGMERLAMGALWRPLTLKKGTPRVDAIRTILGRTGETRYAFPSLATRLPKTRSLDRFAAPWDHARRIAKSMDRQLYYPGNGVCTLRKWPERPVFTFKAGTDGNVVGDVTVAHEMDDFRNVILVVGGKPKGAKKRVRGRAIAPEHDSMGPVRLGRGGEPRWLVEKIENDAIRSNAEAKRRAQRILEDRRRSVASVTFDSLPIPHLDPGDWVQVVTDDGPMPFRLRQFTIPLGTDGAPAMSVGYLKKTRVDRKTIRRRASRRRAG